MRIHVRQWRMLAWLATAGVAAGAGTMLWDIVKKFRSGEYVALSTSHFTDLITSTPGSIPRNETLVSQWDECKNLVHTPINGFEPAPPKAAEQGPTAPAEPKKQKIEDALKLKAITFAPEDKGRVVVEYKDDSVTSLATKDELVLAINGKLAGKYASEPFNATLKGIKPDSAQFDWCGEVVTLHPTKREDVPKDKGPDKPKDTKGTLSAQDEKDLKTVTDKTLDLGNGRYLVGTTDKKNISDNGDKFLGEMKVADRPGANKKPEVVLANVRPNSYVARTYGLQQDDVLVSINGMPISSKTQGYQYVRENPDLPRYDVVIRRQGKEITKTILVPRNK
jgi:hypothetical protein